MGMGVVRETIRSGVILGSGNVGFLVLPFRNIRRWLRWKYEASGPVIGVQGWGYKIEVRRG